MVRQPTVDISWHGAYCLAVKGAFPAAPAFTRCKRVIRGVLEQIQDHLALALHEGKGLNVGAFFQHILEILNETTGTLHSALQANYDEIPQIIRTLMANQNNTATVHHATMVVVHNLERCSMLEQTLGEYVEKTVHVLEQITTDDCYANLVQEVRLLRNAPGVGEQDCPVFNSVPLTAISVLCFTIVLLCIIVLRQQRKRERLTRETQRVLQGKGWASVALILLLYVGEIDAHGATLTDAWLHEKTVNLSALNYTMLPEEQRVTLYTTVAAAVQGPQPKEPTTLYQHPNTGVFQATLRTYAEAVTKGKYYHDVDEFAKECACDREKSYRAGWEKLYRDPTSWARIEIVDGRSIDPANSGYVTCYGRWCTLKEPLEGETITLDRRADAGWVNVVNLTNDMPVLKAIEDNCDFDSVKKTYYGVPYGTPLPCKRTLAYKTDRRYVVPIFYGVAVLMQQYVTVQIKCTLRLDSTTPDSLTYWKYNGTDTVIITNLWVHVAKISQRLYNKRKFFATTYPGKVWKRMDCTLTGSLYNQPAIKRKQILQIVTQWQTRYHLNSIGNAPPLPDIIFLLGSNRWKVGEKPGWYASGHGLTWITNSYPEETDSQQCHEHARLHQCDKAAVGIQVKMWFPNSNYDPYHNETVIPLAPVKFYATRGKRVKRQLFVGSMLIFNMALTGVTAGITVTGFQSLQDEFAQQLNQQAEENNKRFAEIDKDINKLSSEIDKLQSNLQGLNEQQNQLIREMLTTKEIQDFEDKVQQMEIEDNQRQGAMTLKRQLGIARATQQMAMGNSYAYKAMYETFGHPRVTKTDIGNKKDAYIFHWIDGEIIMQNVARWLNESQRAAEQQITDEQNKTTHLQQMYEQARRENERHIQTLQEKEQRLQNFSYVPEPVNITFVPEETNRTMSNWNLQAALDGLKKIAELPGEGLNDVKDVLNNATDDLTASLKTIGICTGAAIALLICYIGWKNTKKNKSRRLSCLTELADARSGAEIRR